jgi:hypothetical protein
LPPERLDVGERAFAGGDVRDPWNNLPYQPVKETQNELATVASPDPQ